MEEKKLIEKFINSIVKFKSENEKRIELINEKLELTSSLNNIKTIDDLVKYNADEILNFIKSIDSSVEYSILDLTIAKTFYELGCSNEKYTKSDNQRFVAAKSILENIINIFNNFSKKDVKDLQMEKNLIVKQLQLLEEIEIEDNVLVYCNANSLKDYLFLFGNEWTEKEKINMLKILVLKHIETVKSKSEVIQEIKNDEIEKNLQEKTQMVAKAMETDLVTNSYITTLKEKLCKTDLFTEKLTLFNGMKLYFQELLKEYINEFEEYQTNPIIQKTFYENVRKYRELKIPLDEFKRYYKETDYILFLISILKISIDDVEYSLNLEFDSSESENLLQLLNNSFDNCRELCENIKKEIDLIKNKSNQETNKNKTPFNPEIKLGETKIIFAKDNNNESEIKKIIKKSSPEQRKDILSALQKLQDKKNTSNIKQADHYKYMIVNKTVIVFDDLVDDYILVYYAENITKFLKNELNQRRNPKIINGERERLSRIIREGISQKDGTKEFRKLLEEIKKDYSEIQIYERKRNNR